MVQVRAPSGSELVVRHGVRPGTLPISRNKTSRDQKRCRCCRAPSVGPLTRELGLPVGSRADGPHTVTRQLDRQVGRILSSHRGNPNMDEAAWWARAGERDALLTRNTCGRYTRPRRLRDCRGSARLCPGQCPPVRTRARGHWPRAGRTWPAAAWACCQAEYGRGRGRPGSLRVRVRLRTGGRPVGHRDTRPVPVPATNVRSVARPGTVTVTAK
jgi:hypothetical protein